MGRLETGSSRAVPVLHLVTSVSGICRDERRRLVQLVREQIGHTHVATMAIYTALSDDFKDRMLYASLGIA
jgi:hypothetical protein